MNVISYVQSEFRWKWSLVGVLWLAVYKSVTIFFLIQARPALARALSTCLRSILHENTEESWKKLFMLPKCLVSSPKRKGRHHKPCSIEHLCDQWLKGDTIFFGSEL